MIEKGSESFMDKARLSKEFKPLARKERLIIENLDGETLIYDPRLPLKIRWALKRVRGALKR